MQSAVVCSTLFGIALWACSAEAAKPPQEQSTGFDRKTIHLALASPVNVQFQATPLTEVVEFFEAATGLEIVLDRRALNDVGIDLRTPITLTVDGISARSALEIVLGQLDLVWMVRNEVISITTPDERQTALGVRVYDVSDLVDETNGEHEQVYMPPGGLTDSPATQATYVDLKFEQVISTIAAAVESHSWDDVGGPGVMSPFESRDIQALVVANTLQVHERIEKLLAELRAARADERKVNPAEASQPRSEHRKSVAPVDDREPLRKALATPVKVNFKDTPLAEVIDYLQTASGARMLLDERAIMDSGVDAKTPITLQVSGISARAALDIVLRQLDLAWTFRHEVVWITSPDAYHSSPEARVYDVHDLVQQPLDSEGDPYPDYDQLIELITTTVTPSSWSDTTGPGPLSAFSGRGIEVLVLSQTREAHEEVEQLLAKLRAARRHPAGAAPQAAGASGETQ